MPRFPERLGKLKGRSIDELRVRCAQAARARLERFGLSPDIHEPSDEAFTRLFDCRDVPGKQANGDELLHRFRQRDLELGQHLSGLRNPTLAAQELQARCPKGAAAAVAAAERIAAGVVDFGGRVAVVGSRPDWMLEPVSRKRAPAIHWSRIAFLDPAVAGDSKFTWELNRHQYFVTLGRAFLLTGVNRYASIAADHLSSWMDENPPQIGINWASSLELALRAISWIWALCLLRHSPRLTGALYLRTLKFLYLHARHIERNLSTYFSPNTHLTGEALGLLYIGTAFPEFKLAQHWRTLGVRILLEQLERQLLADGVYFEQSTYYHRYTVDFYLHALLLTRAGNAASESAISSALDSALDYLLHISRPDGSWPLIGDDDGGRLVMLGERAANDFRDTLAIGAAVLERGDCASVAGDSVEELIWLLGRQGIQAYDRLEARPPAVCSRAFPDSGYFVMRERWDRTADWALVRCGPHAPQSGAHAHADALSLELSVDGQLMLIDPGTYVYTASRAEREYFRSSEAHNTVTIDGLSSAEPGHSPFKWNSAPRSRVTGWVTSEMLDFFEGEHDGFLRLEAPALHSRAVFFLKDAYWVVRDRLRSKGRHELAVHLHWAPAVSIAQRSPDTLSATHGLGARVDLRIFARQGQLSCEEGWVSASYGTRTPAPISVFHLCSEETEEIVTLLANSTAGVRLENCEWSAFSQLGGGVLTIPCEVAIDTILIGPSDGSGRERDGITSDATWTWVRRSHSGEPLAFAMIRGQSVKIGNMPVFQADRTVACATGQRRQGRWDVDVEWPDRLSTSMPTAATTRIEDRCVASAE